MKIQSITISLIMIVAFTLTACSGTGQDQGIKDKKQGEVEAETVSSKTSPQSLLIPLKNTKGKKIGEARLLQTSKGVKLTVEASQLSQGEHGIHFHETGKCEAPDFESAGAHFNPFDKEHGLKNKKGPHVGDLSNLKVQGYGIVNTTMLTNRVTLEKGKKNSLLDKDGSALVIHSEEDDQVSQPSGNSGKRIACGEINN